MKRTILWTITIGSTTIGLFFGMLWFNRLRLDYNLYGKYFDETTLVVYDDDSILVYGLLALFVVLIGMISWTIVCRGKRST